MHTLDTSLAAVLFDMDGTLIDSEPYWIEAEIDLAQKYGKTWTHDDALTLVGNALPKSAQIIREKTGIPLTNDQILEFLLSSVVERVREHIPWRPGAKELLENVRLAGIPSALVTSSYLVFAELVTGASNGAITVTVAGDQVSNGKPHPESYLLAAELLGVDIHKCVAIEDSPTGIAAALASGAKTIGIPCVVQVEARAGLSRVRSLTELDLATLGRVATGAVIDTLR